MNDVRMVLFLNFACRPTPLLSFLERQVPSTCSNRCVWRPHSRKVMVFAFNVRKRRSLWVSHVRGLRVPFYDPHRSFHQLSRTGVLCTLINFCLCARVYSVCTRNREREREREREIIFVIYLLHYLEIYIQNIFFLKVNHNGFIIFVFKFFP